MFLAVTLAFIVSLTLLPRLNARAKRRYDQYSDRCVGPDGVETSKAHGGWPPAPYPSD